MKLFSAFLIFLDLGLSARSSPTLKPPHSSLGNPSLVSPAWFDKYHDYQAHVEYLHALSDEYRPLSRVFTAGKSFEKRNI
ncbi:hypothetical protein C8A01DRAFT_40605 [Parachaetomium inaequale]|uniref:Uncharacterized protein n=1 Tax=Parachaetomium inaequale TaxID=2588326 RepID=A0AAN6SMQ6_9PEZI|nr:hypothetical protein C8A01DRAFT_40605 [Parachaetomium inaequale]